MCVFDPGGNIILFCLMSKVTFTQHHFQPKTENLCVLVYLHDKGILGPENKLLKTGMKCNFFGNNTVMISV